MKEGLGMLHSIALCLTSFPLCALPKTAAVESCLIPAPGKDLNRVENAMISAMEFSYGFYAIENALIFRKQGSWLHSPFLGGIL